MIIKKKAQGAVEFIVIFGGILFFFITFFAIIQNNLHGEKEDKEKILLQNIALGVRDEINLAAESSDGYARNFTLPENVLGKDYDINISGDFVYVSTEKYSFAYKAFELIGFVKKGINNIIKQNGIVYLNYQSEVGGSPPEGEQEGEEQGGEPAPSPGVNDTSGIKKNVTKNITVSSM